MSVKNSAVGKAWRRTNGAEGHEPMFDIRCRFCQTRMVLRHTLLGLRDEPYKSSGNTTNQICYKCPDCDSIQRFDVQDEPEYLEKVLKLRGNLLFIPDMEEWERNETIKRKLASIGYF